MPVFEYKCQQCGTVFELMVHGRSAGMDLKCPSCGATNVEKMFSVPALVKRGSGSGGTCCGREERCNTPPCSGGGSCCGH